MSLILMLAFTLGWHWTLLQSVGWVQMFVTFAQTASVTEALVKTFDGQNPCQVCKLVEEGKRSEQKQQASKQTAKLDLFFERAATALYPPDLILPVFWSAAVRAEFLTVPPKPPPRGA